MGPAPEAALLVGMDGVGVVGSEDGDEEEVVGREMVMGVTGAAPICGDVIRLSGDVPAAAAAMAMECIMGGMVGGCRM